LLDRLHGLAIDREQHATALDTGPLRRAVHALHDQPGTIRLGLQCQAQPPALGCRRNRCGAL
jgi:hypothetical protein